MTIQAGADGEAVQQVHLEVGQSTTFGACNCREFVLRVPLHGTFPQCFAGRVTAADSHWLLTNLSQQRAILVENLENRQEYLTVEPGRRLTPIPFELARVAAADNSEAVIVFGPEPQHIPLRPTQCDQAGGRRAALDPKAIYFAVLTVLCERRTHGSPAEPLLQSLAVAKVLSNQGISINARAVDAHLAYVTEKLGLPKGCGRELLVATTIRRRLLTDT